jgi:hypothetical protein
VTESESTEALRLLDAIRTAVSNARAAARNRGMMVELVVAESQIVKLDELLQPIGENPVPPPREPAEV